MIRIVQELRYLELVARYILPKKNLEMIKTICEQTPVFDDGKRVNPLDLDDNYRHFEDCLRESEKEFEDEDESEEEESEEEEEENQHSSIHNPEPPTDNDKSNSMIAEHSYSQLRGPLPTQDPLKDKSLDTDIDQHVFNGNKTVQPVLRPTA